MSTQTIILSIQSVPGDVLRGIEQPNGDLLIPAEARPLIAHALLQAELALITHQYCERAALQDAKRLLGIDQPEPQPDWLPNLFKLTRI